MIDSTTIESNWSRRFIIAAALLCFFLSESRTIVRGLGTNENELPQYYFDSPTMVRVRKEEWIQNPECTVHGQVLHEVMDRLCQLCHEMFFQEEGNLQSQCRMRCFDNDVFRKCLDVFSSIEDGELKKENQVLN